MRILLFFLLLLSPVQLWAATSLPTREHPLVLDALQKRVLIYTEVNGGNVTKSNSHWGIVAASGKLADKGILLSYADPAQLHEALVRIGARPGNNLTGSSTGKFVAGDRLELTATWPGLGKELPLQEIFEDESGRGFNIRFGGNLASAGREHTGCLTCLESCWIAITSNDRYPFISALKRLVAPNSRFRGRKEILPADRQPVIIGYRLTQQ